VGKLTAKGVEKERALGYHGDGDGLWLQVTAAPGYDPNAPESKHVSKSWILRYRFADRQREMGLGSAKLLGLGDARTEARKYLRMARIDGIDPIEARRAARATQAVERAKLVTFRQAATSYIAAKKAGWKNPKQEAQWTSSLKAYAYPLLGDLPVRDIDTGLVMKVLEPIWSEVPETASRVRGRIESVLDWAKVRGHRDGENPARWRGHLQHQLAPRFKVKAVVNHPALPYRDMFQFWEALAARGGMAAEALRFAILTAARSGEVFGATWKEIDLKARAWVIPADRMKAAKEHKVALSARAVELLERLEPLKRDGDSFVFPGQVKGKPLSSMAMLMLLRKMKRDDVTAHGFRSSFRDWAAETTAYPGEMVEMALAHAIGNKVEAAYRRGDMFERRRRLMDDWATYCTSKPGEGGNVVSIREAAQ
jgi:integrase